MTEDTGSVPTVRLEWPTPDHGRIVLARPERRNALGHHELKALDRATEVLAQRHPRVVSILGEGPSFGVGGDIDAFRLALEDGNMEGWLREAGQHLKPAIARLRALDAAVVVGLHGAVAGGSLGLAWTADHIVAADNVTISLAYASLGVSPDAGTSWFLPRLTGPLRAFELLTLRPTIDARQAHAWGLVNDVVPLAGLTEAVDRVVARLLAIPVQSLLNIKRLLRASPEASLEQQLFQEFEGFVEATAQPEFPQRVQAFLNRAVGSHGRPPAGPGTR